LRIAVQNITHRQEVFGVKIVLADHLDDFMREEHLSEFVAEILDLMLSNYEEHRISEILLKRLGSKTYSDKPDQDNKLPKTTSKFLLKYSELQPKDILKNMVHLNDLLDSESHTIRGGLLEVMGNIIHGHLAKDDSEIAAKNLNNFFEILLQRYLDASAFVRARVLKIMSKLAQRHPNQPGISDIPISSRQKVVDMTILRLRDKGSLVRKKAMELLMDFLENSPFIAIPQDLGSLSESKFEKQANSLRELMKQKFPEDLMMNAEDEERLEEDSAGQREGDSVPNAVHDEAELKQLRSLLHYYQDAQQFSRSLNQACTIIAQLLNSTLKTEVVMAMKFFVTAYRFELEGAEVRVIHVDGCSKNGSQNLGQGYGGQRSWLDSRSAHQEFL
jgi:condensin complex subunit 1